MHRITILALVAASLTAGSALADTTYKVDKIEINGVKSVSVDDLRAVLKDKPGDRVTIQDIIADQDTLVKALEKLNVTGGVKTSKRDKPGNHIDIIYDVNDNGEQKPTTVTVAPKLNDQVFTGNNVLTSNELTVASGLKPGDELNNDKIKTAQQAILNAYKASKKPVNVTVSGALNQKGDAVEVVWTVVETKAKKRPKDTEDQGFQTEAQ